jgi:hypothetical protein
LKIMDIYFIAKKNKTTKSSNFFKYSTPLDKNNQFIQKKAYKISKTFYCTHQNDNTKISIKNYKIKK